MALSTLEIAKRVLEICAKPMHVDEIAQHSVAMGLSPAETVQELSRKLSTSLAQHVKSRHAFFRKIKNDTGGYKRGIYALKKQGILPRHRHRKIVLDNLPHVSTQYTGAAGEHAVYAELLFRGFNASIMTVDEGIDIVASRENRFFHIQVKTANESDSCFSFSIRRSIFEAHMNGLTFYVFVIRRVLVNRHLCEFVVLPSVYMQRLVSQKVIKDAESYSLRIKITKEGDYILNGTEDLNPHVNCFSQIS